MSPARSIGGLYGRRPKPAITSHATRPGCRFGRSLNIHEEVGTNSDVFLDAGHRLDPELVLLEEVAEQVAVDQLDGLGARVASWRASLLKLPVVMSSPLSPRPAMAPRKSRTFAGDTLPRYRLHWKKVGKLTSGESR